ncbi:CLUMA_CG001677, isoform A [Clunio marinus]|uniref:CLUMA_CG001677, isoform A n=1 Tax=Clunio marinus TaxID=568069 RepID=A0A1J1HK15_9DIPT|nr:CLUMA_CG001677, isoform A [Clunio marinus]
MKDYENVWNDEHCIFFSVSLARDSLHIIAYLRFRFMQHKFTKHEKTLQKFRILRGDGLMEFLRYIYVVTPCYNNRNL